MKLTGCVGLTLRNGCPRASHETAAKMSPGLQSSEVTGAGRPASKVVQSQAGKVVLVAHGRPQSLATWASPEAA